MLEVVTVLVLVALVVIAKFLRDIVIELRDLQNLIWSANEEPEQPSQEELVRQYIGRMLDADIELQRSRFWNGH